MSDPTAERMEGEAQKLDTQTGKPRAMTDLDTIRERDAYPDGVCAGGSFVCASERRQMQARVDELEAEVQQIRDYVGDLDGREINRLNARVAELEAALKRVIDTGNVRPFAEYAREAARALLARPESET